MASGKQGQQPWLEAAQQFQQQMVQQWTQLAQAFPGAASPAGDPMAAFKAFMPGQGAAGANPANPFGMPLPGVVALHRCLARHGLDAASPLPRSLDDLIEHLNTMEWPAQRTRCPQA